MSLRIIQYGESILHVKGECIVKFDNDLYELSQAMLDIMYQVEGIGLAAQQIGRALRFCVVDVPENPENPTLCILDGKALSPSLLMPLSLANPEVSPLPSDQYYYEEGCLSFPGIRGDVARPERILVRYQDLDGATHELECDGLLARCIQHEADHLEGILFTERMEKEVYAEIKSEVKALKKKTLETLNKGTPPQFPIPEPEE